MARAKKKGPVVKKAAANPRVAAFWSTFGHWCGMILFLVMISFACFVFYSSGRQAGRNESRIVIPGQNQSMEQEPQFKWPGKTMELDV